MDREQQAWAVLAGGYSFDKEAGWAGDLGTWAGGVVGRARVRAGRAAKTLSEASPAEIAARTASKIKGGPTVSEYLTAQAQKYRAARLASMSPEESARFAREAAAQTRKANEAAAAAKAAKAAEEAAANPPKTPGGLESFLRSVPEAAKNNPLSAAAGMAALGVGGVALHRAGKAYNAPMARAMRFAKKNKALVGAGAIGTGLAINRSRRD
jgi:hypothetical protein